MRPKGESTDMIVEDYLDLVSNFPSELRFNLESIRDTDSQVKRMIDKLRSEALSYLKRMNAISSTTEPQTPPDTSGYSKELLNSLRKKLNSEDRVKLLLETPDNEARISLLNYYKEYRNALEKTEREVIQVRQAIEALNTGNSKLSFILSNSRKNSNNYAYGYKQFSNVEKSSETPNVNGSASFNTNGFKKRSYIKNRIVKHRKEAPCSKDEVLYCTCRQVSYGDMVGCDNENCEIEWFHYKCVGLTASPEGTWYCDQCTRKLGIPLKS